MSDRITLMLRGAAEQEARWAREAAEAKARVERDRRERAEAAERQLDVDLREAARLMQSAHVAEQVKGYRLCLGIHARRRGIRIVECAAHEMPPGATAYYNSGTRTVTGPRIVDATTAAAIAHEFGHDIAGPCAGAGHQAVQDGRWHNCVECERLAWEAAMRLVPFTREMFGVLQRNLAAYRRKTPAPAATVTAARQTASDTVWARRHNDRVRRDLQIAEMRAIANSPRVYTRAERDQQRRRQQIRELDAIARELREALNGNK